jgi:NTE family protein
MADPNGVRVLCLAGGAPNLTLMSGALHTLHQAGLHQNGKGPNVITMAGAGTVVGLHYLAPKGLKSNGPFCLEALENTFNFGVSDAIHEMLPINYKVFTKAGPAAEAFNEFWHSLPEVREATQQHGMTDDEALISDSLLLAGAISCPLETNFFDLGICGHAKFLDDLIDFEALQRIDPNDIEIEINAFCIEDRKLVDFTNYEIKDNGEPVTDGAGRLIRKAITVDHLRAALAFPFLHAPYKIGDKHYFEGAAIQCLNDYRVSQAERVTWVLLLDPLRESMIGMPSNLWEAFALSIIVPTVGLTELGRSILKLKNKIKMKIENKHGAEFKKWHKEKREAEIEKKVKDAISDFLVPTTTNEKLSPFETMLRTELYLSEFEIPPEKLPQAWGWSRSSMKELFEVGKIAGAKIAADMRAKNHL